MALPIRTTIEDVQAVCAFLAKKPTGATPAEARKILDEKYLDGRKLAALKLWKLIDEQDGRLKITEEGRRLFVTNRGESQHSDVWLLGLMRIGPLLKGLITKPNLQSPPQMLLRIGISTLKATLLIRIES